jgi:hypothetical protein
MEPLPRKRFSRLGTVRDWLRDMLDRFRRWCRRNGDLLILLLRILIIVLQAIGILRRSRSTPRTAQPLR